MPPAGPFNRRHFLKLAAAAACLPLPWALPARATLPPGDHPDPRPGIDGSKVMKADQLTAPDVAPLFDGVREMPHIADGIRCYCGCATIEGYRSLLSCYEAPGMAQFCEICQGQARLAHGRWKEGQSLAQIRRAIDARYGRGTSPDLAPGADSSCH